MSTLDNLKEAFAGESQANQKIPGLAKKADEEGYHQVAKLFRLQLQQKLYMPIIILR